MSEDVVGQIVLVKEKGKVCVEELVQKFPSSEKIFAVDFYIEGAESWTAIPGGWVLVLDGVSVYNIDHHAPDVGMMRRVSSGNLAARYVGEFGTVEPESNSVLVINHCDADSIVSVGVLLGIIEPEERFMDAVIAADHTGEENLIADVLQGMPRSLRASLDALVALRDNGALPIEASEGLKRRVSQRKMLEKQLGEQVVSNGEKRGLVLIESSMRLAAELLPALIPEAKIIITAAPLTETRMQMKIRLGQNVGQGVTLFSLGVCEFDDAYGGRWNAGSNRRGGGSVLSGYDYAKGIAAVIEERVGQRIEVERYRV